VKGHRRAKEMLTGPEGILNDILSSVRESGTYEVESSILLSGVFQSEDELEEWSRGNGLRYEKADLPGTTGSGKKIVTFSARRPSRPSD
jgi:hypothetical protein